MWIWLLVTVHYVGVIRGVVYVLTVDFQCHSKISGVPAGAHGWCFILPFWVKFDL